MSAMSEPRLPFDDDAIAVSSQPRVVSVQLPAAKRDVPPFDVAQGGPEAFEGPDVHARRYAVDPTRNVVLEASAGTGKTRVLVERYVNLLRAREHPRHYVHP